jgi:hypothetical protein
MLTKISHLPATELGESCYRAMFYKCDKLTKIPNLPATELAPFCYHSMFYGCTNLISAKNVKIKATVCPSSACNNMFTGCSGLQEPLELAFEQIDANGCYQMFYKCHNLKYAPQMNLRSVSSFGLQNAFYNCYSLSAGFGELNLTDEIISEKAFYCCYYNCSSLIENIPTVLPNTQLSTSCFAYMFYGCSALSSVPELPATKLGNSCYSSLFNGCSSLTQAPELPATDLKFECYKKMFNGCTSLIQAPVLPATTLASGCYYQMFYDCHNLNYMKVHFTEWTTGATENWVTNVGKNLTNVGVFKCPQELSQEFSTNNIPTQPANWNVETDWSIPLTFTAVEKNTQVRFNWSSALETDLSTFVFRTKLEEQQEFTEWKTYNRNKKIILQNIR